MSDKLNKSIDQLIDAWFGKSEMPSMLSDKEKEESKKKNQMEELTGVSKKSPLMPKGSDAAVKVTVADKMEKPEEAPTEKAGERGRPKDPSAMGERDEDGESHLDYDSSITEAAKAPENETTIAKSTIEISKEDFEFLQKAKQAQEQEVLQKAKQEQTDLIKSAITSGIKEAIKPLKEENSKLSKKLDEASKIFEQIKKRPTQQKSVTKVAAIEKSFGGEGVQTDTFTKSEMLDAAEELMKSGKITVENVIELENTGFVYDPSARREIENFLKRSGK